MKKTISIIAVALSFNTLADDNFTSIIGNNGELINIYGADSVTVTVDEYGNTAPIIVPGEDKTFIYGTDTLTVCDNTDFGVVCY